MPLTIAERYEKLRRRAAEERGRQECAVPKITTVGTYNVIEVHPERNTAFLVERFDDLLTAQRCANQVWQRPNVGIFRLIYTQQLFIGGVCQERASNESWEHAKHMASQL